MHQINNERLIDIIKTAYDAGVNDHAEGINPSCYEDLVQRCRDLTEEIIENSLI